MMSEDEKIDFNSILTNSIRDMKNSLFILLQSIEHLDLANNLTPIQHKTVADLHYQTSRINDDLIQSLFLYNYEQKQFPINIEKNSIARMFQEVLDRNRLYLNSHHINVVLEVDEALTAYFDEDLVTSLITNIFVNALRYSNKNVMLRAFTDKEYVNIQVDNDGEGYPEQMLAIAAHTHSKFNVNNGRSELGLLFAQKIASEHKRKLLQGHILLENKSKSRGSLFTLRLP